MNRKKILSLLLIIAVCVAMVAVAVMGIPFKEKKVVTKTDESIIESQYDKESIYLWYTDEALSNYLNSAALAFNESHGVRIMPVLQSNVDYMENINSATIEADVPDMYILTNDSLEKAYMAGLADPINPEDKEAFDNAYLRQAYNAISYKDMYLGYPLYFETSTLLYNETYMKDMAVKLLDQEEAQRLAEEEAENAKSATLAPVATPTPTATVTPSPTATSVSSASASPSATPTATPTETPTPTPTPCPYSDEEIQNKVMEIIPLTMSGITELANVYDAPEAVESVFTWDVTDIFYNYFFIGDAISLGGEAGWDKSKIDVYNVDAISSLEAYQSLNQFFSIDTKGSEYSLIVDDFINGKIVFTIATTDIINVLEQAKADGTFTYDYGLTMIPDMNEEIETRSLSLTDCLVVNPYSKHKDIVNEFAMFMTTEYTDILYNRSGKIPTYKNVEYDYPGLAVFASEYEYSISMPKMMETSNFWVQLEAVFADIWDGDNPNERLKELAEKVNYQLTGVNTELEMIVIEEETEEIEYLDEEALRQQAQEEE